MGRMYKTLNGLGMRGVKACKLINVSVNDFKEHFQRVLCDRYEVDPGVIEGIMAGTRDLREVRMLFWRMRI